MVDNFQVVMEKSNKVMFTCCLVEVVFICHETESTVLVEGFYISFVAQGIIKLYYFNLHLLSHTKHAYALYNKLGRYSYLISVPYVSVEAEVLTRCRR